MGKNSSEKILGLLEECLTNDFVKGNKWYSAYKIINISTCSANLEGSNHTHSKQIQYIQDYNFKSTLRLSERIFSVNQEKF